MTIYILSKDAVLETFDDCGLVLVLPEHRLVDLNPSAVEIIHLLDRGHTPEQVAVEIANKFIISLEQANQDVWELIGVFIKSGILALQSEEQENKDMTIPPGVKLLCNPDVVLREEDPDEGALLFNPDTNQVKVINITGLFIWKQCGMARTPEEIVTEIQKSFDEVPLEQVAEDVQEFFESMLASGFIGTLEKTG